MLVRVWLSVGLVGADRDTEIEVDDDATDKEIEEAAREAMFEMMDWGWEKVSATQTTDG